MEGRVERRRGAGGARWWPPAGRILLLCSLAAATLGCGHRSVALRYEQVEQLAPLAEGGQAELWIDGEPLVVTSAMSPRLVIRRTPPCSVFGIMVDALECTPEFRSAPDRVEAGAGGIRLQLQPVFVWQPKEYFIRRGEIESIELSYDPPDRRPTFGVGLAILGPSRFGGIQALWIPASWLVFDGGFAALAHVGGTAWAGARIRPLAIGDARPFVGAFSALLTYQPGGDPDHPPDRPRDVAHGARVGVDLDLGRHVLLTLEVDAFLDRSAPEAEVMYERDLQRFISGGFSLSYLF